VAAKTRVFLEIGSKRAFASAAGWPGWCRSGKNEKEALDNLAAYAPRYVRVARLADIELPKDATNFQVVERMTGNATTDFGAPGVWAENERQHKMTAKETDRMVALAEACWKYLDQARRKAPPELRKGPRGGGRDRDEMFNHVLSAEMEYAKRIGTSLKQPDGSDASTVKAFRRAILEGFTSPNRETKWPIPYAVRRTAWHALDHAWEMEDRLP
jgi:hypothetical protein